MAETPFSNIQINTNSQATDIGSLTATGETQSASEGGIGKGILHRGVLSNKKIFDMPYQVNTISQETLENPSVHIITDVYEKNFASREEAYKFFRFLGEIPKNKEKAYRANIDKYVFKIKDGFRFEQKARSYLMWWDTREIKKHKDK